MSQASRKGRKRGTSQVMEATQSNDVEMVEDDSTPPLQGLTQSTRTSKVSHLARHLLHASSKEKDGALKDALAQKQHLFSKREYCHVLREASNVLQRSFGCKVIHRANQSHVVRMDPVQGSHLIDTMDQTKKGLLSAILMFIFLSKSRKSNASCITDTMLQNFLKSLGLSYDTPDAVFGDIKKLISPSHTAEFIHDGYISFAKTSDRYETQMFTYDWGPRAILVCEPKAILASYCSIIKDPEIDKWEDQLDTVKQMEEERRQVLQSSEKYIRDEK
ncbi:MAGE domain-containing protein [Trichostrongylus colubriformis]|uniref:MAGE domain-containing protein n=1 Tax=Trichostrongylus colubriformis TaxID=6319 RepID=A0AAN8EZM2_TRICO